MTSTLEHLLPRAHIQNFSAAETLEPHWGYAVRALPCTNDPGSCEYLDTVYHAHDVSMLYSAVLWAVIGGTLVVWGLGRRLLPSRQIMYGHQTGGEAQPSRQSWFQRVFASIKTASRTYLLPESLTLVFGRVTRLNILILLMLVGYLTIFTFIGIVYKTWITPVKNHPGVYNTRTGLGPWSDRIGVMAFALTPLSILLANRESLLSQITGVSYQHFNFLHRYLGYVIFLQSGFHSIGWIIVEARLYQPQPTQWDEFIAQKYMMFGIAAIVLLTILVICSARWCIKLIGYETFRKTHYLLAMLYIGCCWGHWEPLSCWMIASLVVWLLDRGARLVRTALLHYIYLPGDSLLMGFRCAQANIRYFPDSVNGDVVRLDFEHSQDAWHVGQHFFLCFPELSLFQSHPFTPLGIPTNRGSGQAHSYLARAKKGETKRLAQLAERKKNEEKQSVSTSVILSGPYGAPNMDHLLSSSDINVLCVAGGTGITFVLPVLLSLAFITPVSGGYGRKIQLIWILRKHSDVRWVQEELSRLNGASQSNNMVIHIYITREDESFRQNLSLVQPMRDVGIACPCNEVSVATIPSSSSSVDGEKTAVTSTAIEIHEPDIEAVSNAQRRRPNLRALVRDFVESTAGGPTCVYASGPMDLISDMRQAVASCNSARKVLEGDERYDVQLVNDDRLEW